MEDKIDIHKMSVDEFAVASEDNKLWQAMIWTKAREYEKQIDTLRTTNSRYKSALEEISDESECSSYLRAQEISKEALKG